MNSKKNKNQKKEERIARLANTKIELMQQKRVNRVEHKEIVEVFDKAENFVEKKDKEKSKKRRLRNAIIAILGALGIAVGGHAMLPSGNVKDSNINVTEEKNNKRDSNSKFRSDMKADPIEEDNSRDDITEQVLIDEILDCYNSKLDDENKIDKENLRNNIAE